MSWYRSPTRKRSGRTAPSRLSATTANFHMWSRFPICNMRTIHDVVTGWVLLLLCWTHQLWQDRKERRKEEDMKNSQWVWTREFRSILEARNSFRFRECKRFKDTSSSRGEGRGAEDPQAVGVRWRCLNLARAYTVRVYGSLWGQRLYQSLGWVTLSS
jgi:hypothetical protein